MEKRWISGGVWTEGDSGIGHQPNGTGRRPKSSSSNTCVQAVYMSPAIILILPARIMMILVLCEEVE